MYMPACLSDHCFIRKSFFLIIKMSSLSWVIILLSRSDDLSITYQRWMFGCLYVWWKSMGFLMVDQWRQVLSIVIHGNTQSLTEEKKKNLLRLNTQISVLKLAIIEQWDRITVLKKKKVYFINPSWGNSHKFLLKSNPLFSPKIVMSFL